MIDRIVIDVDKQIFNSPARIKEKLNYYRILSQKGISTLSDEEFEKLKQDIKKFFNFQGSLFADTYPTKLFRISFNKNITHEGRGGRLKNISQLIGPPPEIAKLNRCNMDGDSVCYFALDLNTAIWETRPVYDDVITISTWKIKEGKKLNLSSVFSHEDIHGKNKDFVDAYKSYREQMGKLQPALAEISEAIEEFKAEEFIKQVPKDMPREYIFSASFSTSLMRPSPGETQMDGIVYPSVQRKFGVTNIAIRNSLVLNRLDLISVSTHDVMKTYYEEKDSASNENVMEVFRAYSTTDKFDFERDTILYPHPMAGFPEAVRKMIEGKEKDVPDL